MSVPLENVWGLHAVQDGVVRERNMLVEGFPLAALAAHALHASAAAPQDTAGDRDVKRRAVTDQN